MLLDMQDPQNTSEVRLFMGLIQYVAKYLPDVVSVANFL